MKSYKAVIVGSLSLSSDLKKKLVNDADKIDEDAKRKIMSVVEYADDKLKSKLVEKLSDSSVSSKELVQKISDIRKLGPKTRSRFIRNNIKL